MGIPGHSVQPAIVRRRRFGNAGPARLTMPARSRHDREGFWQREDFSLAESEFLTSS
jgi:hypothetical protein